MLGAVVVLAPIVRYASGPPWLLEYMPMVAMLLAGLQLVAPIATHPIDHMQLRKFRYGPMGMVALAPASIATHPGGHSLLQPRMSTRSMHMGLLRPQQLYYM